VECGCSISSIPIDYQTEIRRGNIAAGILLAAVIVALAAIIIAVIIT
jgi:hypothetical protein